MENNDPLIGKQLGTCVLDHVIGAGGMGMVYLAHQTRPVRDVAVKVLRSGAGLYTDAHQEFLARFRREANVIAKLDHINILHIYGYDEQDGLAYFVMPHLTGGSLRTVLEERGKLSPQEAFKYLEQAGAALQYAHEHQIVHRDIKPGNMLFHADGRLVLADFGIARIVRDSNMNDLSDPSLTAVGQFLGSAEYMAPEMVRGHKVDHRADLYELGIVLFQMLIGRVPFQGSTVLSIAAMHIHETPQSLIQLDSSIPPALDVVMQRVLSKNPEDRYVSAHEFVEAVRIAISVKTAPIDVTQNSNHHLNSQYASSEPGKQSNSAFQSTQNRSYVSRNPSSLSRERVPYATEIRYINQEPIPSSVVNTSPNNVSTSSFDGIQFSPAQGVSYDQPSKSHPRSGWIVILSLVIVLCIMGVMFGPTIAKSFIPLVNPAPTSLIVATVPPIATHGPPTATPTLMPSEKAKAVIQLYYSDINSAEFADAYSQLSAASQLQQPYPSFMAGYAHTRHDEVIYESILRRDDGTYQVNVTLTATNIDDNGILTNNKFTGYYIVGVDNNALKIFPNSLLQKA